MARKSMWCAALAVGALLAGCKGKETAFISPAGAGQALLAWSAPATYQNEAAVVTVNPGRLGASADPDYGLHYTHHFNGIPDTDKPYGLQNFFFSKSSARVSISDFEEIADAWSVACVYLVPNTKLQLTAEVGGAINDVTNHPWWPGIPDEIAYKFGAQYSIKRELKVRADFITEASQSQADLGAIYIAKVGGQSLAVFLEGVVDTSTGSNDIGVNVGLDYYLTKELSVGGLVTNATEDLPPTTGTTYTAKARYYTGPMTLGVSYTSIGLGISDVWTIDLGYRF